MYEQLRIVPVSFRQAAAFIAETGASLRAANWRVVAQREAHGSWAESSVQLRNLRDPVGSGGVQRTLWEAIA